jgi:diguanylate cyclase (GGDEF)-like protein
VNLILALAVALTVVGAAVAVYRARTQADDRVAEAVRKLAEGMQQSMRDLTEAYEHTQVSASKGRLEGELASSLDLEEVAERALAAIGALPGVDAAILEAEGADGRVTTTAEGISPEEAERTAVRVPDNDNLRAVGVQFRYRLDDAAESGPLVRGGVVVPVRAEGEPVGTISAFTRSPDAEIGDATLDELERLAYRAGPAIQNARRFAEARQLADLDALTGLHNRRYFHETLSREVVRAHRYGRGLGLVIFDLDDFKAVNDRIGHLAGDGVLAEVAARVLGVTRSADVACRVGGDEFGVILPESTREEAELLAERIGRAIAARPIAQAGTVYVSAGVAAVKPDEGAKELFERADEALYRAKGLGKARTVAAEGA